MVNLDCVKHGLCCTYSPARPSTSIVFKGFFCLYRARKQAQEFYDCTVLISLWLWRAVNSCFLFISLPFFFMVGVRQASVKWKKKTLLGFYKFYWYFFLVISFRFLYPNPFIYSLFSLLYIYVISNLSWPHYLSPHIYLFISFHIYISIYLFSRFYLFSYLSIYQSIDLSITSYLSNYLREGISRWCNG